MSVAHAQLGVAGHAGVSHTHGPGGLVQDDSFGFSVVASIIRGVLGVDTRVASVSVDLHLNTIKVTTADGGTGESSPRRGITPSEARLISGTVGCDALFCQTVAIETLGRMYSQGVMETPAALQAALANAVVDTFHKKAPSRFFLACENLPGSHGLIGGISTKVHRVSTSVMATVNASLGGMGPNEDLEGNVALGGKAEVMRSLDMLRCPTIVLEGKGYFPPLSDSIQQATFLVRVQEGLDNIVVAEALHDAAKELGYPVLIVRDAFPRRDGLLRRKTVQVADTIIETAERLKKAERSSEKVRIAAELAMLISQDVSGVTFMSNEVNDIVRQAGLLPGTSAVLSMLVTREYMAHWKIPLLEQDDIDMAQSIVYAAIPKIAARFDEASSVVEEFYADLAGLETLLLS